MAIENAKLLNVRIKNKYDSYENWASSGLVLEAGEIAIAHTSVDVKVDNGTAKHPALLMKVGDGASTFAQLPWLSAKAADVLSVCKNEDDLKGFVNGVIANAGIATDAAMKELSGKVTTAEGAIKALQEAIGENGSVAKQIEDAIAALNLAETYAAKEHVHVKADITDFAHNHEMSEVNGLADALAGKQAAGDYAAEVHTHVMADITDLADELAKYQLAGDYATKAEAQAMADAKDEAIAAAKKAGDDAQADVDALELVVAKQADVDAALALKADQTALQAEIDRAKAAEKVNADAIALLTNGVSAEEVDGVNDLIQYVKDHGTEVTGMKADIKANADAIDALEAIDHEAYKTADATLKSDLEGQIALKADASDVTAMDAAYKAADTALKNELTPLIDAKAAQTDLEALELLVGTEKVADQIDDKIEELDLANTYEAKGTAETLNTAMNARVEVLEAIDHTKFEAAGAAAQALTDAKAYTDGKDTVMNARVEALEEKDVVLYSDTIVFDCGTSAI